VDGSPRSDEVHQECAKATTIYYIYCMRKILEVYLFSRSYIFTSLKLISELEGAIVTMFLPC